MRKKIMITIIALCVMSFVADICVQKGFGEEGFAAPVIGKAIIKSGTVMVLIVRPTSDSIDSFEFTAYEDTEAYINRRIESKPGIHDGGYLALSSGLYHRCPTHGKELIGNGYLIIGQHHIDAGQVQIILFSTDFTKKN